MCWIACTSPTLSIVATGGAMLVKMVQQAPSSPRRWSVWMSGLWNSSLRLLLQSSRVIGSCRQLVYTIQPVVKPVWQTAVSCIQPVVKPVWQPVVSCERGFSIVFYTECTANVTTLPCYVWQRSGSCHDISVGVGISQTPVMWCDVACK